MNTNESKINSLKEKQENQINIYSFHKKTVKEEQNKHKAMGSRNQIKLKT